MGEPRYAEQRPASFQGFDVAQMQSARTARSCSHQTGIILTAPVPDAPPPWRDGPRETPLEAPLPLLYVVDPFLPVADP